MRRRTLGFSITEVLISIAVLAISITGVLAALAYDAFSAEQSGAYTFAVNYSRRILDLMQSGQIDPTAPGFITATTPAAVDSNPGNDGTNWRDLDDGLLNGGGAINLWGAPGSVERQRFDIEKLKYGVNLAQQRVQPTKTSGSPNNYKNLLMELTVTTRWRVRRGFRSVQLRGYYATSETP